MSNYFPIGTKNKNGASIRGSEKTEKGHGKGGARCTAALEAAGQRAGVWRGESVRAGQLQKQQQKHLFSHSWVHDEVIQQVQSHQNGGNLKTERVEGVGRDSSSSLLLHSHSFNLLF